MDTSKSTDSSLTLDHVLDVAYPGAPSWSADGRFVAATLSGDTGSELIVVTGDGDNRRILCPDEGQIAEFTWHPAGSTLAFTTDASSTYRYEAGSDELDRLAQGGPSGQLAWSSAGDRLATYHGGVPMIRTVETGETRSFDVPEWGTFLADARMLAWSDDDTHLAFRFTDRETKQVGVVDVETGSVHWRSTGTASTHSPTWLDDSRLLVVRTAENRTRRAFVVVDTDTGRETVLYETTDTERGVVEGGVPTISPDSIHIAATLPSDGWAHVHVRARSKTSEWTQLTEGNFEDRGVAGSSPQWIDDETLLFASNRRDPGQRQLFTVTLAGDVTPVVDSAGTNVFPRPSPDSEAVAYLHADRERSPELRVRPLDIDPSSVPSEGSPTDDVSSSAQAIRLTESTVADWPVDPITPESVTFESSDGREIHSYLIDPRDVPAVETSDDLPAVIWVHGGPMRQMREGWHPSRSYGLAYTAHQYLAHFGYVGLFVNYRGGIGYGREFRASVAEGYGRDEMADIVAGADYLAELPYVDEDSLGIWGLSYGGYATLQILGTHPETFAVGVNLAGLSDIRNYEAWATETKRPHAESLMPVKLGGDPWVTPSRWDDASPTTHMAAYESPVYNFHGTDDRYVTVEQQDIAIERLLNLDKAFEAEYYPGEGHVFSKRATWRRTLQKVKEAFDTHLK